MAVRISKLISFVALRHDLMSCASDCAIIFAAFNFAHGFKISEYLDKAACSGGNLVGSKSPNASIILPTSLAVARNARAYIVSVDLALWKCDFFFFKGRLALPTFETPRQVLRGAVHQTYGLELTCRQVPNLLSPQDLKLFRLLVS